MTTPSCVPFHQARQGAVIEFEVFAGQPFQGTVQALTIYGARNFLVLLSKVVDHRGNIQEGVCLTTGTYRAINLDHAVRVLTHSQNPLVFDQSSYGANKMAEDLAKHRCDGVIRRQGQRLVIDGRQRHAPGVVRDLVVEHLHRNAKALGILPWDVLDHERLLQSLTQYGIVRTIERSPRFEDFVLRIDIHAGKMKRFIQRNINRFKCDTRAEERARMELEEEMYREDMDRDYRDAA